ncbi:FMN-binding protein [Ruminococcus sp. Marseille-P6503]|uniref:FMN-binding protein n=1 Tax=Ruminococcus sp. Marseille-P6503 TaxID=2364796 RepID=UPI000F52F6EA|nr:FMN-binding protein [Ruminococcus sp. Marseille-P6503]
MKNSIMPPLALTVICIVVSGLLAIAYNKTYVDTTGVMTDELKAGCEDIFGEGDYEILLDSDAEEKTPVTFDTDGVVSVITDGKDKCLVELVEDGYSKGGLHLLIGINSEGAVEGIYFLEIGETPGVGTKVQEASFLDKLIGFDAETDENSVDNITSATYSSKGMKAACKKAVTLYSQNKEAIFSDR